jgi:hypothetical protein
MAPNGEAVDQRGGEVGRGHRHQAGADRLEQLESGQAGGAAPRQA